MRPTMAPCGIARVMFAEEEEKHLSEANKVAWRGMDRSRAVAMATAHCLSASTLNEVINGSEDIRSKKIKSKKTPLLLGDIMMFACGIPLTSSVLLIDRIAFTQFLYVV